jgi:hypothetical protein
LFLNNLSNSFPFVNDKQVRRLWSPSSGLQIASVVSYSEGSLSGQAKDGAEKVVTHALRYKASDRNRPRIDWKQPGRHFIPLKNEASGKKATFSAPSKACPTKIRNVFADCFSASEKSQNTF